MDFRSNLSYLTAAAAFTGQCGCSARETARQGARHGMTLGRQDGAAGIGGGGDGAASDPGHIAASWRKVESTTNPQPRII